MVIENDIKTMKPECKYDNTIKTQADAVVYFIQRLDIDMINDILDDNRTYQDMKKNIFIHKLGICFDEFTAAGDTFLHYYGGHCRSKTCNFNCSGFSFVGNNSKNYLDLIIDTKEGVIQDIYECGEFCITNAGIEKKNRIRIEKFGSVSV
jgi:hypothetical protein